MPDNKTNSDGVEVSTPETIPQAKIKFMSKAGFDNPTPSKLDNFLAGWNYFCVTAIGTVAATDLFNGYQSKVISLCLALAIAAGEAIRRGTGVVPADNTK